MVVQNIRDKKFERAQQHWNSYLTANIPVAPTPTTLSPPVGATAASYSGGASGGSIPNTTPGTSTYSFNYKVFIAHFFQVDLTKLYHYLNNQNKTYSNDDLRNSDLWHFMKACYQPNAIFNQSLPIDYLFLNLNYYRTKLSEIDFNGDKEGRELSRLAAINYIASLSECAEQIKCRHKEIDQNSKLHSESAHYIMMLQSQRNQFNHINQLASYGVRKVQGIIKSFKFSNTKTAAETIGTAATATAAGSGVGAGAGGLSNSMGNVRLELENLSAGMGTPAIAPTQIPAYNLTNVAVPNLTALAPPQPPPPLHPPQPLAAQQPLQPTEVVATPSNDPKKP